MVIFAVANIQHWFMKHVSCFISFSFFLSCFPYLCCLAYTYSDSLLLHADDKRFRVVQPLQVWVDDTGELGIQEVLKRASFIKPNAKFFGATEKEYTRSAFWFSFSIHNASHRTDTLYIPSEMSDWVDVYQWNEDAITALHGGLLKDKTIDRPYFDQIVLPIIIPPQYTTRVYVRIKNNISRDLEYTDINLYSKKELSAALQEYYMDNKPTAILQILFLGFVLWQTIYMSFQWFMNRRKEYIYYVFYTLFIGAYFYMKYAFDTRLFWPTEYYHWISAYAHGLLLVFPYFLYMRFVRYFLDTGTRFPLIDRWLKRIEWFIVGYTALELALLKLKIEIPFEITTAVIGCMFVGILFMGSYLLKHRDVLINFLVAGAVVASVGSTISMTLSLVDNWRPVSFGPIVPSQIGLVLEMCFFTAGLGYKARMNEEEKIKSQKQLIVQLEANQTLHERMHQIRNKIAQDLHDDVGATLSTILLYTNAARHKAASLPSDENAHFLLRISESATQMIDEMSDIVWAINSQNDSSERIFSRMHTFAAPLLAANNIAFVFNVDESVKQELFVMDKRKNLYLIFKEAINNAVKYSGCTCIEVLITKNRQSIEMTIRDDGKGFDYDNVMRGNGLSNFEHRAHEMNGTLTLQTSPGSGTVIKVSFSL